jgi:hypothetical protein
VISIWSFHSSTFLTSGDSRLVPNTPGRIGLWFYQLCASLRYGNAYLFWCKLHHSNPFLGETVHGSSIVESWAKVVKKLGTNGRTLLTMDSYYFDVAGRQYFQREGVNDSQTSVSDPTLSTPLNVSEKKNFSLFSQLEKRLIRVP